MDAKKQQTVLPEDEYLEVISNNIYLLAINALCLGLNLERLDYTASLALKNTYLQVPSTTGTNLYIKIIISVID